MRLLTLKNILLAGDPQDLAAPAVLAAVQLAAAAGASLHVVSVVESSAEDQKLAAVRAGVARALEESGGSPEAAAIHVVGGDPALTIGRLADRISADVMVLGPHRKAPSGATGIGGTALAVVTNASCPCLIAASTLRLPLHEVVVPVDLSDTARGALLVGLSWASALRTTTSGVSKDEVTLTAMHVSRAADSSSMPRALEQEIELVRKAAGTWAGVSLREAMVISSTAARAIVSYVDEHKPDLVVLGTRGLGLDAIGRVGSVTASVASVSSVPTLLVPPAVWLAHRD